MLNDKWCYVLRSGNSSSAAVERGVTACIGGYGSRVASEVSSDVDVKPGPSKRWLRSRHIGSSQSRIASTSPILGVFSTTLGSERLHDSCSIAYGGYSLRVLRPFPLIQEHRYSDSRQNTDDDHDDQQLYQREASFVPFHLLYVPKPLSKKFQHVFLLVCCSHAYTTVKPALSGSRHFFGHLVEKL